MMSVDMGCGEAISYEAGAVVELKLVVDVYMCIVLVCI